MAYLPLISQDVLIDIQKTNLYQGKTAYLYNILGRRSSFNSTTVYNDVVEFAQNLATIPVLTGSETLEIVSTSANDSAGGTGTRQVKVVYVDATGNLQTSPAIALNGTTPVSAGFMATGIFWMEAVAGGSSDVSVGNIILRTVTGQVEVEQITAGGNKSRSARILIPNGYMGFILGWEGTAIQSNQDILLRATVETQSRAINSRFLFQDSLYIPAGMISSTDLPMLEFPAGARIKVSTISAGAVAGNRCDVSFTILLLQI